jgi:hypothetical protein
MKYCARWCEIKNIRKNRKTQEKWESWGNLGGKLPGNFLALVCCVDTVVSRAEYTELFSYCRTKDYVWLIDMHSMHSTGVCIKIITTGIVRILYNLNPDEDQTSKSCGIKRKIKLFT